MSKHDIVLSTKRGDNNVDGLSNRDALPAKDDLDIDALIRAGGTLPQALAAARALLPARCRGEAFNPQITLKALAYFGDGNLAVLPEPLKLRLQDAVRSVDLSHLPSIKVLDGIDSDERA